VAKIAASPIAGCAPLGVSFADASTGNPTSWTWDFGGVPPAVSPATSNNPSAAVIYTVAGTYTVTLTVSNANGSSTATPVTITIFPTPIADFSADKLTGCFPTTVHFTDMSNPGAGAAMVSWTWSYGDGTIDPNIQNPSHTYTTGGSFPVTLYVKNNYGCQGSANIKTGAIVLSNGVIPNYNAVVANSCQVPVSATFTNQTTGPATLSYVWDFGDGSGTSTATSPVHTFNSAGNYKVLLTSTSTQGCQDTISSVVNIASSNNVSSFDSAGNVCINTPITFTNTSSPFPISSTWNYGDGSPLDNVRNGLHTYTVAGPYLVTLNNSFSNCNGSVTQSIRVVNLATAAFIGTNIAGCIAPLTASFTDQSVGATSWLWNFGDGTQSTLQNPAHIYTTYGSFNVTLTASSAAGCSSTLTKNAFVNIAKPLVSIPSLPAYGCAPYTFTPSFSVTAVDGVASYQWDFGNGVTFNGMSPPPQTYGSGTYTVSLTIITNGGCTASTTGIVKVGTVQPVPGFIALPTSACVGQNIQFTDQSTGGPNQWLWNFGDGNTSTVQNPIYGYLKPGTFDVTLTAYNNGCFQSITKPAYVVINNPLADFNYSFSCASQNSYTFTDASTGPTTWDWNFGDGSPDFLGQSPPVHVYAPGVPTTYNVTLKVTNGGCTNSITKQIMVNQVTTITVPTNPVCNNNVVTIFTTHPANIVGYIFNFGDGTSAPSGSGATTHTYSTPGNYNITVTTTDNTGCVTTSLPYVMHVSGPTAQFTTPVKQACGSLAAQFTDQSVPSAGAPIKTWDWVFGDGGTSSLQNPVHNYTVEGIFSVMLKVTDINGCTDSVIYPGYITFSSPQAKFTTAGVNYCPSSNIKFTNTSQSIFSPVYTWNFEDGTTYTGASPPLHNFLVKGQYAVTLSIVDSYGCTSSFTMPTPINIDVPVASFTMSSNYSACPPLIDSFTFTGSYAQTYLWNFGDGGSSNAQNAIELYPTPGDWDPTITIISPGGCIATAPTQHVHVDGPVGQFTYSPLGACDSLDVTFQVKTANVVQFTWIFGDKSLPVVTTVPTITHEYNTPGQYLPAVTLEDAKGCKVVNFGNDSIYVDAITKTSFAADKTLLCDNGTINFTNTSILAKGTVITNYLWDFGDGTTQPGLNPTVSHYYSVTNTYNVTLTITTVNGCAAQFTLPVTVVASPQVDIGGLIPQCEPATLNYTGIELVPDPNGPLTWSWSFGNGQTSVIQNPPAVNYPKAGQYFVQLIAKNTRGCVDTATQQLNIYQIPVVNAGPDMTVCLGGPDFQLNATGDPGNTYTWQPPVNGTLSCYPCANPMANSPVSTYFVVNGLSPFGCQASDTVNITVNMPVTVTVSGPDSVCLGQSAQLVASGAAIYNWTPAEGLSNTTIANPVATPTSNEIGITNFQVTGWDNIKCFSDTKSIQITTFNYPTLNLGPNVTIPVGTSYQINGTGSPDIVSLNWLPPTALSCTNCLTPLASPIKTTDYVLNAINNGGCASADSIKITVICNNGNFFIPNTFSPNGDGVNDRFIVRGKGLNVIPSITIYNRWGQVVFEKSNFAPNDEASGWDGTFNGKPAPSDVYIYTIQILCDNATLIPYHGNVTLIR
jgi:gliding motility-associated-like protein